MRKPDAETYELGHWESMTIQRALTDYATQLEFAAGEIPRDFSRQKLANDSAAVAELANIFAFGTHTVTRKAEEE